MVLPWGSTSQSVRSRYEVSTTEELMRENSYEDVDDLLTRGLAAIQDAILHPPTPCRRYQSEMVLVDASRGCQEQYEDEDLHKAVILHVYHVSEDFQTANDLLSFSLDSFALGGAFHVGVEVFGTEWSYGCCGVQGDMPRSQSQHVYNSSIYLGCTHLDEKEFSELLYEMCAKWRGADYQLLSHNCCSFATQLISRLGTKPVPAWTTRFPRLLAAGMSGWTQFEFAMPDKIHSLTTGTLPASGLPSVTNSASSMGNGDLTLLSARSSIRKGTSAAAVKPSQEKLASLNSPVSSSRRTIVSL